MPYDSTWFSRYDTMIAEAGDLKQVQDGHKTAKDKLAQVQAEADAATKAREKSEAFMKEQETRISLVQTHWFYGTTALQPQLWMRGGVEGKKARAQAKLDIAKSEHPVLQRQEKVFLDEKLPAAKEEVRLLAASIELKKSLLRETEEMKKAAIDVSPSSEITRLRAQVETLKTTISETTSGADGIVKVAALCSDANEHYAKACKAAEEANAAGRDAEPVIGPAAAKQSDNARPPSEPAEHAEAKERLRAAAVVVLKGEVETLKTTMAETAAGGDGLKIAHNKCSKASTCYAAALKMTLEAAEAHKEADAIMQPPNKPPLYGAHPACEKKPCPAGCGNALTGLHPTHCCPKCAELNDGVHRPDEHEDGCARIECADVSRERAAMLEHLRAQATDLKSLMKDTSEGAEGLKSAGELCVKAKARYERCLQLTKWAAKAEAEADKVLKPARPCPGGCGFAIADKPGATYCCGQCERGTGEHGPKCEARPCGTATVERAAALKKMRAQASLLKETLEDKTWSADAFNKMVKTCKTSHEHYLKAMQARRAADRLAPSPLDDVAATAPASASASASVGIRDAKMREVQKEGDEGAKMLQMAIEGLPGGTHGAERFKAQYDAFRDVSALASDMDSLATVQGCVALVADKMKIVEEVEATLRKEVAALKGELEPIEQAFKDEAEREKNLNECAKERADGDKLLQQGMASVPPAVFARYTEASQPLVAVQLKESLQVSVELAHSLGNTCKELETTLRADYDVARGRLAPIELAIKAAEKSDALVHKAQAEADKGAEFLQEAFKAVPETLPRRYPQTLEMIGCEVTLVAATVEAVRVRVIRQMAALASLKERKGKEYEVAVRKDHDTAKAELKPIELALKAEEQRNAKMSEAQIEGDRGANLLHQASATVPAQVPVRYPQASAPLVGLQVPLLAQINPQDKVLAFLGGDGKGSAAEWASSDKLRQTLALTGFCKTFSAELQANAKALETTMRGDVAKAKVELQETKDAIPAEEERIFADLRKKAG